MTKVILLSLVLLFLQGIQVCFSGNSRLGCIEEERQALLRLKQSFKDPSSFGEYSHWRGVSANRLGSWTGEDCCHWRGVGCNQSTGHVVNLDLRVPTYQAFYFGVSIDGEMYSEYNTSEQLSAAEVHPSLAELTQLEYLDLSGNYFNGSRIPEFIGSLKNLRYLNLSQAGFQGRIPHQLGNLTSLQVLDLRYANYYFLGESSLQWASSLSSLKYLDMSGADLSTAFDLMHVLSKLPSLIHLSLGQCGIQNIHFLHVNSTFLGSLRFLDLSRNHLSGEIPKPIHNLTALRELRLSYQGSFYSGGFYADNMQWLSRFSSLQFLGMSGANLSKAVDVMHVLSKLPSLIHLSLRHCGIQNIHFSYGPINSTFFATIQNLDLSFNSMAGPIPNDLKNMTALRYLDISFNEFNSTFPLGLVNPRSLVFLDVMGNSFDNIEGGLFSLLNNACSLKSLYLLNNHFRNEVLLSNPNSSRCPSYDLESLTLDDSELDGNIPDWLGYLKGLKYLSFARNSLSGPIPSSIGELSMLSSLDLSSNQLSGTVPQSLGSLLAMESLSLSHNQLSGNVPQSLGSLSSLLFLDLSHNQLSGTVPQSLGSLSAMESLSLSHNQLSGIPESLGQLVNLRSLDISSNPLEGQLHFANLSKLEQLDISANNLTWEFETKWIPPFSLYSLNMSYCRIGPQFPQWLQTQTSIHTLDISNSNVSGDFSLLPRSSELDYMDLSANQITGSLPANIADTMPHVSALFLGNNMMNGSFPNSICNLESLQILDISKNMLSGEIPNCWRQFQKLSVINLSSNKLSGTIPSSLGHLSVLKWLHLDGNNLSGNLPLAMKSCTSLELLDVGENNISGVIPDWVGESLLSLKILRLRQNNFSGNISAVLCRLSKMQILDLALNNLSGGIPRCLGKLKGMTTEISQVPTVVFSSTLIASAPPPPPSPPSAPPPPPPPTVGEEQWHKEKVSVFTKGTSLDYTTTLLLLDGLDLSSNNLDGPIPEELCGLAGLRTLNLSHNRLIGNIPNQIGNFKSLESFDLSHNRLFGQIPQAMSELTYLSHLNLSYNNLSGKIPTGNQLQTLNDPSMYAGNLQLCGPPLTKKCDDDDDEPARPPTSSDHGDDDKKEKILFWFVVTSGYAVGLWTVIGVLVLKKNWRIAYFRFVDNTKEWILVVVAVTLARLKQRMHIT